MIKWLQWIVISVFLLMFITPLAIWGYVKYQHYALEKETLNYLIDKGYSETEILSIESKLKKLSLFTAEVRFRDEPEVVYDYRNDGIKFFQMGEPSYFPENFEEDYEFKHLE